MSKLLAGFASIDTAAATSKNGGDVAQFARFKWIITIRRQTSHYSVKWRPDQSLPGLCERTDTTEAFKRADTTLLLGFCDIISDLHGRIQLFLINNTLSLDSNDRRSALSLCVATALIFAYISSSSTGLDDAICVECVEDISLSRSPVS